MAARRFSLRSSDDRNYDVAITSDGQVIYQADLAGAEIYDLWMTPLHGRCAGQSDRYARDL